MDPAGQLAQLGGGRRERLADPLERGTGRLRVALGQAAREPHVQRERDEPLLRAVVEVALDPAAGVVGGLDDARARGAQLRGPGRLDLLPAQRLLGLAPLGDVEDRAVHPAPAAGAGHELTAIEHPADLAVGAHDAVLEHERTLLVDVAGDGRFDPGVVVGVDHAHQRPARAGDEAGGRVAGDALDLIRDQLEPVAGVPRRAVDRAGHGGQQRAQQRGVGPLLHRAHADTDAGQQLRTGERPRQVVVGAALADRVGRPARDGDQPRVPEPGIGAQRAGHGGGLARAPAAVGDHQVGRLVVERVERRRG